MDCHETDSSDFSMNSFGLLEPTTLRTMARNQATKYAKWTVKYDKNRDEDHQDEEEEHRQPELKRKRPSPQSSEPVMPAAPSTGVDVVSPTLASLVSTCISKTLDVKDEYINAERELPAASADEGTNVDEADGIVLPTPRPMSSQSLPKDIVVLAGHEAEVFCCSWHPHDELLASGSGDSTVRLWNFDGDASAAHFATTPPISKVLEYVAPPTLNMTSFEEDHDVTTLEWSGDGTLLATGCMDGIARLWSRNGILRHSLAAHSESIFSLRFDALGKRLLTGSYDKCVSVWDVNTGGLQHKFEAHSAQVLDVDWKHGGHHGHDVFASCSTDRTIAICALSDIDEGPCVPTTTTTATTPLQVLVGHADEVNAIRWDPPGKLLASCSDDHNVFVWQLGQSSPVYRFSDHTEEIYTIRWSPTGPSTSAPNAPVRLASASFDATVRLWDTEIGVCSNTLCNHTKKVYTIAFSPNGTMLASGSLGGQLNIWDVATGGLIKTFNHGSADIFEVAWNSKGTRLAATSTNAVSLMDIRMM